MIFVFDRKFYDLKNHLSFLVTQSTRITQVLVSLLGTYARMLSSKVMFSQRTSSFVSSQLHSVGSVSEW